jgi:cobalt/nickel transport system permease protein
MSFPKSLRDLVEATESLVYVDDVSRKKGLMQSINPLVKLVVVCFMVVASLFVSWLPSLAVLCLAPLTLAALSRIPLRNFTARSSFFIPFFAAVISLPMLFLTPGSDLFTVHTGFFTLTATLEGLQKLLVFTLRVWFCVACLTLLTLSTGIDALLKLLVSLKVPAFIVQLFSLTYRYLFVSLHELQKTLMAKEARTFNSRRTVNAQTLRETGTLIAGLFMKTYERAERVYLAMKSRGFELEENHRTTLPALRWRDAVFVVSAIAMLSLFVVL